MNPILLSLVIASGATLAVTLLAIPLAHRMSQARFHGKAALETVLTLPLVLPPTVVGYAIVLMFGANGLLGRWGMKTLGYSMMFRIEGAMLAAAVVSFPLLYLPAKAAFVSIDREMHDLAALLGASRGQMFWYVSLPMASRGILSGVALCFARALGEFGATVMVFGWQPGRVTMPIAVYAAYERGEMGQAAPLVICLMLICFALLILINRTGLGGKE